MNDTNNIIGTCGNWKEKICQPQKEPTTKKTHELVCTVLLHAVLFSDRTLQIQSSIVAYVIQMSHCHSAAANKKNYTIKMHEKEKIKLN